MAVYSPRKDSEFPHSSRRAEERHEVTWEVDCAAEDTFLYAYITNVSSLGVFVRTTQPLPVGTRMRLLFAPRGFDRFELWATVQWINPLHTGGPNLNPGMGIRFVDLTPEDRERLVEVVHTIAYVRDVAD